MTHDIRYTPENGDLARFLPARFRLILTLELVRKAPHRYTGWFLHPRR
jgi:hypothetical protein